MTLSKLRLAAHSLFAVTARINSVTRAFLVLVAAIFFFAAGAHATTWTVSDASDNATDANSLRYALAHAGSGDTIVFSSFFDTPQTITLGSALPAINVGNGNTLSVVGPGSTVLTINAAGYTAFTVTSGEAFITNMTITKASPAILVSGSFGALDVTSCNFLNNSYGYGGAIYANGAYAVISSNTFYGNTAANGGGAIEYTGTTDGTITNNTFYQNSVSGPSGKGGAIDVGNGASVGIANNTFVDNSAFHGGAINSAATPASIVTIVNNNIFYLNTANNSTIYNSGYTNSDHNLYFGNTASANENNCGTCTTETNVISNDPMLLPFGYYGTSTQSFELLPGSGAICHATVADSYSISSDQRGYPLDPTCASGYIDIGSMQTNHYQVNTTSDDATGVAAHCLPASVTPCTLRDAVYAANNAGLGDITFKSTLSGGTITLSTSPMQKFDNGPQQINILGLGADKLTVSGNNDGGVGSIFYVDAEGVIYIYGLTITGGTSHWDTGSTGYGGGIYTDGVLTLNSTDIVNNTANPSIGHPSIATPASYGGGIYMNSGSLTIIDSTISGNASNASYSTGGGTANSGKGGGISLSSAPGSTLTIIDSTISGNTANWWGGGIDAEGINVNAYNTTISNNQGGIDAGGLFEGGAGGINLYNSIIDGNTANNYKDTELFSGALNTNNSLVGTGTSNLGVLNYYGSPIETMLPLPGSAAICTGSAADIYPGTTTDERGYPNENTTYIGYSTATPCVDLGAVQTDYTSLQFLQQPTDSSAGSVISPSPTLAVYENGNAVNGIPLTVTLTGTGTLGGTLTQTTGDLAVFNNLTVSLPGTGDELGSSLTISPSGASKVITLSAVSNTFNVSGAFSQFSLAIPSSVAAGQSFNFTVTAQDSGHNKVTGYTGTVHFTTSDAAAGVLLPMDYTFVPGDNGTHTFSATLVTLGAQTITATDTGDSNFGTSGTTVVPGPPSYFTVTAYPSPVYQYTTNTGTVTAYDQFNNIATGYAGPAVISSSTDLTATITQPSVWTNGTAPFTVLFDHTGGQIITASETGISSGSEIGIVVNAPPTYVVTTVSDDASGVAANCPVGNSPPSVDCSLRDALAASAASGGGQITFSPSVFNTAKTITLGGGGTMIIPPTTSITGATSGSGPTLTNLVTVSGAGMFDIFQVNSGTLASIKYLILANGSADFGGAINNSGNLTVSYSTLIANQALESGGGIYNTGTLTLDLTTLSNNSSGLGGGGIENIGTLTVNDCTLTENSTNSSGGAIENSATVTLNNTTVSVNSADSGGGISNVGSLHFANSIISGNTATSNAAYDDIYGTQSDSGGSQVGVASINLAPLGNYGGPTQTMVAMADSPAICGGLITKILPGLTIDQRGNPRTTTAYGPSCVDSGATQSAYSLTFSTEPGPQQVTGVTITPYPAVELLDNGVPINLANVTVTISAVTGTLSGTTSRLTNSVGVAGYGDLSIGQVETNDNLVAKVYHGINFIDVASSNFNVVSLTLSPNAGPLTSATVGVHYSQTFSGNNGATPYTYAKTAGSFPAGLTLNPNTGVLSGTPTAGGNFSFTIKVTDANNATTSQAYTLVVNPPTIVLAPITLPNGTYNTAYNQTVTASGGTAPYNYQITSGTKPTGLSFNTSTGQLSGTPTAVGPFNFTVTATDSTTGTGPFQGSQAYTVNIGKASQTITFSPSVTTYTYSPTLTFGISASATSSLAVTFTSETTSVCTVSPSTSPATVTVLSAGTCTIQATQAGNSNYNAATPVTVNFSISKAAQTISFLDKPPSMVYSAGEYFVLVATSNSGLTVNFTTSTPSVCSVSSIIIPPQTTSVPDVQVLSAGLCTITASQPGNNNYAAATPVTNSFTITQAPTATTLVTSSKSIKLGQSALLTATVTSSSKGTLTGTVSFYDGANLLSSVSLSGGTATYNFSTLIAGTHSITAKYNGSTDFASSTTLASPILITVSK